MKPSKDPEPSRFFNERTLHLILIVGCLFTLPPVAFIFNRHKKYVKNWIIWLVTALSFLPILLLPLFLMGCLLEGVVNIASFYLGGMPMVSFYANTLVAGIFEILFLPLLTLIGLAGILIAMFTSSGIDSAIVLSIYYFLPIFYISVSSFIIMLIIISMKKIRSAGIWWMILPILSEALVAIYGIRTFLSNLLLYKGLSNSNLIDSFIENLITLAQTSHHSILTEIIMLYFIPAISLGVGALIAFIIYRIFKQNRNNLPPQI